MDRLQRVRDLSAGIAQATEFSRQPAPDLVPKRTALLIIDMNVASTGGTDMSDTIATINRLIRASREVDALCAFSTVAYHPNLVDMGTPRRLKRGSDRVATLMDHVGTVAQAARIDPAIEMDPGRDVFFVKKHSSCFFGTPLLGILVAEGVDTVVLTGCSVSGCIRAAAMDAAAHGLRVVVPVGGVADNITDREGEEDVLIEADLAQIDVKFGQVLGDDDVERLILSTGGHR